MGPGGQVVQNLSKMAKIMQFWSNLAHLVIRLLGDSLSDEAKIMKLAKMLKVPFSNECLTVVILL